MLEIIQQEILSLKKLPLYCYFFISQKLTALKITLFYLFLLSFCSDLWLNCIGKSQVASDSMIDNDSFPQCSGQLQPLTEAGSFQPVCFQECSASHLVHTEGLRADSISLMHCIQQVINTVCPVFGWFVDYPIPRTQHTPLTVVLTGDQPNSVPGYTQGTEKWDQHLLGSPGRPPSSRKEWPCKCVQICNFLLYLEVSEPGHLRWSGTKPDTPYWHQTSKAFSVRLPLSCRPAQETQQ